MLPGKTSRRRPSNVFLRLEKAAETSTKVTLRYDCGRRSENRREPP